MNPESQAARDRWLERVTRERFAYDRRLEGLAVTVRFDGGVAHVDGHVATEAERAAVRAAVTGQRGVFAMWDGVLVGNQRRLRVVDLGCGATKQRVHAVGVDLVALPGVDVVADFRSALPFADSSLDRVYAVHVLEHLVDVVDVMNELHRVLAPAGTLHVMSPDWRSTSAIADPTHVRFFSVQTFKHFCTPRPGTRTWWPHLVAYDGANVIADLTPVADGDPPPPAGRLGLFFD